MIDRIFGSKANLFLALLLPLLILLFPMVLAAQEGDSDDADKEQKLQDIGEQRAVLERELHEIKQAENLVEDDLESIDTELTILTRRIDKTKSDYSTKQQQVDFFNKSNAQAMADLDQARSKFKSRLVAWYKSGAQSVIGSLMTAGNISDFLLIMSYTEAIMESDQGTIDFIKIQQDRIIDQTEKLEAEIDEAARLLSDMNTDQTRYEELRDAHYTKLTGISEDKDATERALNELEASSYEIAMLLQADKYTSDFNGTGMIAPVSGSYTSDFGMRRHPIFGGTRMHTGLDYPMPYGTLIHAAQDGVVAYAGWKNGYGNTVIINHGNGLATLYGHASTLEVSTGDTVARGQVVAKVGSTGYSTGPHVHFEVRVNGDPVDPKFYLP